MRRLLVIMMAGLVVALAGAPAQGASAPPSIAGAEVGVSDNHRTIFDDAYFQSTGIRRVRYFVYFDAIDRPEARERVLAYVLDARAHGVDVLMHVFTNDLRVGRGTLPSVRRYRYDVGRLVALLRPLGVRTWGVWNEANHKSEPTFRHPERAAAYATALHDLCRGCTIVDLDLLDIPGATSYLGRFVDALGPRMRRRRLTVGIHNYGDVNRGTSTRTAAIIERASERLPHARFWLTETGGIVQFAPNFPCSVDRAAKGVARLVRLLRHFRGMIERAYLYSWFGTDCSEGFDAGLLDSHGRPRPGYAVLRQALAADR